MMKTASSAKNCQDGLTKQAMAIARRKDNYILDVRHGLHVNVELPPPESGYWL